MKSVRISLLLSSLFLFCLPVISHDDRFAHVEYAVTDLGHGIYRLEGSGGNIGLSIGEDGAFLIDDQFAPLTPKLLKAIGELTDQPVKYVINTHWHGDHVGGNANLAAEGAVIVAHDKVRTRMAAPGDKQFPEEALPVITFSDTNTYYLNGHKIHAFHVEQAHTDGDAIIHFPEANIIHAGDILFNGRYPYIDLSSGGSVDGYLAAMKRLLALADDETKIIAGHGPLANRADVERSIRMVSDARDRVATLVETGMALDDIQEKNPLADLHEEWSWAFITTERFTGILYNDLAPSAADPDQVTNDPAMLDFWIGDWDLTWEDKEGKRIHGTNTIRRVLDGAVVHEAFDSGPDLKFKGQSYSVLDRATGVWKQVWVDSANGYLDFTGHRSGDRVVFHREGQSPDGEPVRQRMVFHDIGKDAFTWDWESSTDGETWTLRWRIFYKRKR